MAGLNLPDARLRRLALVCATLSLLSACGGDETASSAQPEGQPAAVQATSPSTQPPPESDQQPTGPSPLLDQPKPAQPVAQSPTDLPPITARIAADMPDHIVVSVNDPLPVSAASLVDPQGRVITAARIDHSRVSYKGGGSGWPRIGFGLSGGSSSGVSTGFGIGIPLFPQTSEAAGSVNESSFSFTIPDIAAYNGSWQRWKIHVDLSDGVNTRSFETLPPAPPRS
ncbi:MAG TPA: hypothetical protein VM659_18575 [Dongiaceae bacterium]|nr:hypothetical protein [Dongiaceae bacterium]